MKLCRTPVCDCSAFYAYFRTLCIDSVLTTATPLISLCSGVPFSCMPLLTTLTSVQYFNFVMINLHEIYKILNQKYIIYCLIKFFPKKSRKFCDTLYMILLQFSLTKHDAIIKNISVRKMVTLYYHPVKILLAGIVLI